MKQLDNNALVKLAFDTELREKMLGSMVELMALHRKMAETMGEMTRLIELVSVRPAFFAMYPGCRWSSSVYEGRSKHQPWWDARLRLVARDPDTGQQMDREEVPLTECPPSLWPPEMREKYDRYMARKGTHARYMARKRTP